ncbi:hypothetical protein CFAM422_011488 [Trichoderma lentiforme]|uniref:Uncharacterized protein n=1 Tax=Trichoderma lentiforme TaxID=1567552 RepID=A0A9P4X5T7_9HYPO|nr:hypothetical protein CFAM422_011488 [Trichoderma lentiforme]
MVLGVSLGASFMLVEQCNKILYRTAHYHRPEPSATQHNQHAPCNPLAFRVTQFIALEGTTDGRDKMVGAVDSLYHGQRSQRRRALCRVR